MRPDLQIRRASSADAECLAALGVQTWLHTYATRGIRQTIARYVHEHLTPNEFRKLLDRPDAVTLVAEIDGHLVGFAVLEFDQTFPAFAVSGPHLDKLFVQEHFLGIGVGSALLRGTMVEAKRRGCESELWLTVNSLNERARNFYARHGFKDIGHTQFDLYGEKHENRILQAPAA